MEQQKQEPIQIKRDFSCESPIQPLKKEISEYTDPYKCHQHPFMKMFQPEMPKAEQQAVITFPDGKKVNIPVLQDKYQQQFLDVRALYDISGYFTFDPGFTSTASCLSSITYIDGLKGKLLYRGYNIEDLAEHCSYMEVCYLLLYGCLPSKSELIKFEETVVSEMLVHEQLVSFYKGFKTGAHPMAIMTGVVGALSAFNEKVDISNPGAREAVAIKLIAKMPTLAAISYRTAMGLPIVYPKKKFTYIQNFLYMMFDNPMEEFKIDPNIVKAIDVICILHADHEQNASTSTVRIAGSSQANPYACIAAGIASLWGPAHGGANEAVLNQLEKVGSKEHIPEFIEQIKNKEVRLMGFGHRIYKNVDPRAKKMAEMCSNVLNLLGDLEAQPLLKLAQEMEHIALKDQYFISRKLYPNVDFYTGIVFKAVGIPKSMFTVMFAMSRSIGWITQWIEMASEENIRIGRPRQIYCGETERVFKLIQDRELEKKSRIQAVPKLNKFNKLIIL